MDEFKNEILDIAQLPHYQEASLTPITPRYWNVIRFNFWIVFFISLVLIGILFITKKESQGAYFWVILPCSILFMGFIFYALKVEFKKRSYAIRTHDLIDQNGFLSTKSIIIPFQRIQHVAINEGFLSRRYGLAQLQIFTAGGSSSDVKISGLLKQNAERIKEQILRQISPRSNEENRASQDIG